MIKIGELKANIAGDSRYIDVLEVFYVPEQVGSHVVVKVKTSTPAGGMDTLGSQVLWSELQSLRCEAHPKCVIKVIKDVINDKNLNFKRYGKPSKNFEWYIHCGLPQSERLFGLNASLCEKALNNAIFSVSDEYNDLIIGE